jgi:hypothetical protein
MAHGVSQAMQLQLKLAAHALPCGVGHGTQTVRWAKSSHHQIEQPTAARNLHKRAAANRPTPATASEGRISFVNNNEFITICQLQVDNITPAGT